MQIGGLVSGIDSVALVDQLMSLERKPILLMNTKKDTWKNKLDTWRDINTRLSALKTKVGSLKNIDIFKAASSDSAVASVSGSISTPINLEVLKLATATKIGSTTGVGTFVDPNVAINSGTWKATPTAGTFTVNDNVITVNDTDSLNMIIDKINASGANVTATYNATDDTFSISSNDGTELRLGSGSDTSNFLNATKVLSQTGEGITTVKSPTKLGSSLNLTAALDTAGFNTPVTSTTVGEFVINGETFAYDSSQDSLQDIIDRVNSSEKANVTMSYDAHQDMVLLESKSTGRISIGLQDVSGNLLQSLKVTGATQSLGNNAEYKINGTTMTSTSNTIADAVSGVTFTLKGVGATSLTQDVEDSFQKIKAFVDQYNSVQDFANTKSEKGALLQGDFTLINLQQDLRFKTTGTVPGLTSALNHLAAIGIDTDKAGKLSIDEAKLKTALKENGEAVYDLFNGTQGVATRLESYTKTFTDSANGIIPNKQKSYQNQIDDINKRIESMEQRLEMRRESMLRQFRVMEKVMSQTLNQGAWLEGQISQMAANWKHNN